MVFTSYTRLVSTARARSVRDKHGLGVATEVVIVNGKVQTFCVLYDRTVPMKWHIVNSKQVNKKAFRRAWGAMVRSTNRRIRENA